MIDDARFQDEAFEVLARLRGQIYDLWKHSDVMLYHALRYRVGEEFIGRDVWPPPPPNEQQLHLSFGCEHVAARGPMYVPSELRNPEHGVGDYAIFSDDASPRAWNRAVALLRPIAHMTADYLRAVHADGPYGGSPEGLMEYLHRLSEFNHSRTTFGFHPTSVIRRLLPEDYHRFDIDVFFSNEYLIRWKYEPLRPWPGIYCFYLTQDVRLCVVEAIDLILRSRKDETIVLAPGDGPATSELRPAESSTRPGRKPGGEEERNAWLRDRHALMSKPDKPYSFILLAQDLKEHVERSEREGNKLNWTVIGEDMCGKVVNAGRRNATPTE